MMPGADAILRDQEGRSVLRFERTLRHPPERVWRALTDASELASQGDGSLLVLTHTFADRFKAARDAAGWHLCLDALTASLDDRNTALSERFLARSRGEEPPDGTTGEWRELNAAYQERFGIPPEEATPPPEPLRA